MTRHLSLPTGLFLAAGLVLGSAPALLAPSALAQETGHAGGSSGHAGGSGSSHAGESGSSHEGESGGCSGGGGGCSDSGGEEGHSGGKKGPSAKGHHGAGDYSRGSMGHGVSGHIFHVPEPQPAPGGGEHRDEHPQP